MTECLLGEGTVLRVHIFPICSLKLSLSQRLIDRIISIVSTTTTSLERMQMTSLCKVTLPVRGVFISICQISGFRIFHHTVMLP